MQPSQSRAGDPARFDRPVYVENLIGGSRLGSQISQKIIAPARDVMFEQMIHHSPPAFSAFFD
jgi:hypothetical protein